MSADHSPARRHRIATLLVALALAASAAAQQSSAIAGLPTVAGSVKFAVIGDMGTGDKPQYDVADQLVAAHKKFPFDTVIMLGDNLYGSQTPADFVQKFEKPY